MSAQTSYATNIRTALAGMIYALHDKVINSKKVETEAGIGFGVAVTRGTDTESQIDLAGSANFLGITVRSLDREGAANSGDILYKQYETAGVMESGYIYAVCPTGCNPEDPVKYTDGTGVLDAGTAGAGETQLDNAQWETVTAAGEVGVINLYGRGSSAGA